MKTVMFWSYKGGSGRTVAAANAAAALAKLGQRVAVIDLDFEGPGLHHVLGVEDTGQFKNGTGIQHYLRGDIDLDRLDNEVMIDMFGATGPMRRFQSEIPDNAVLFFVLASPKVTQVNAGQNPQVVVRLRGLLELLRAKHEIDYAIIDAASGLRDAYSIAADVSDEIVVFFRWSVQHVEGTLHMIRYMGLFKEFDQRYIPFRVVASAVPKPQELEAVPDDNQREALKRTQRDARTRIVGLMEKYSIAPAEVFYEVPEIVEMKWKEGVTVFGQGTSPYQRMAEKLLQGSGV